MPNIIEALTNPRLLQVVEGYRKSQEAEKKGVGSKAQEGNPKAASSEL